MSRLLKRFVLIGIILGNIGCSTVSSSLKKFEINEYDIPTIECLNDNSYAGLKYKVKEIQTKTNYYFPADTTFLTYYEKADSVLNAEKVHNRKRFREFMVGTGGFMFFFGSALYWLSDNPKNIGVYIKGAGILFLEGVLTSAIIGPDILKISDDTEIEIMKLIKQYNNDVLKRFNVK